jgi:FkbM family methyltransferase
MPDIIHGDRIIRISEQHARYRDDMEKYFDSYFNSVEPRVTAAGLLADFSQPAVHRYKHNGLEFVLSSLPEEAEAVLSYTKHATGSRLAFDVGAYCGVSTYELSKCYERVVAFEPDPLNRECLIRNIRRHSLNNVIVVPRAMTAAGGRRRFFGEGALGSRLALGNYGHGPLYDVETCSLTESCIRYGVPDFIGMDIEAAEIEVLDSSRDLLRCENISLCVDTNNEQKNGWTFGRVESILHDCGYSVETGTPGGFYTTWGWKE